MRNGLILRLSVTLLPAICMTASAADSPNKVPLWSGKAPVGDGAYETAASELKVYLPPPDKAVGAAVVICPGGGYIRHVVDREGYPIADWLNAHGIAAILLEYRLPEGRPWVPLLDAQRAIRVTRANAAQWRIDPERIGILGFSAGGHVASTAGTHFDSGRPGQADPIERVSCRPDFMLLVYPVVTMGEKTHGLSKTKLLGANPKPELVELFSNETQVTDQTPPAFLAHARDDTSVPPDNSRMFVAALRAHQVAVEYLELPSGGHGLDGCQGPLWEQWKAKSLAWLASRGFIPQEADRVAVKTAGSTIAFDRTRKGAVVSLVDNATGVEFINPAAAQELFAVAWSRPGDTSGKLERLSSRDAEQVEWDVNDRGITAVFKRLGGHDVTVTCTASTPPGRDDARWQLRVTGKAPIVIERVDFPILDLRVPLAEDGSRDAVVAGLTKGGVFHEPAKWKTGQGLSLPQPGSLAAQFGCYYSPRAGLVSHSRDARGFPKVLECLRTKDGLKWCWQRRCYHPPSAPFELGYEIATATFNAREPGEPADWRDAADIYKRWALEQPWCAMPYAKRGDVPDWMKAGPGMIRFSREWIGEPERVEGWLSDYWQKHFPGVPLIVALWGWERIGSWISPKYFPPYPSEAGFSRIVSAAQRAGGHAFPWPSGYYWNVEYQQNADGTFKWKDWDDFNATGLAHAIRQRDGAPLVVKLPWLQGGRNAALCRGDAWTRQWFNRNAVTLMQLGCDMVQVDQVVGGLAPGKGECFSTEHGHPPGVGLWDAEAFTAQLKTLAADCRRVRPDAVLSIEEPQELFNHLIGVQDYRDAQSSRWPNLPGVVHASIFGYLYHEYLPVFQSNPQRGDLRGLAYCAVTGQIPHWVPHWPVTPSPALVGGDFEQWTEDVPAGWQRVSGWQGTDYKGRAYRDDGVKAQGATSLRLENKSETDIVQVSQNVPAGPGYLEAGKTYRLRLRAKVEQLARPNAVNLAALTPALGSKGSWRIPLPKAGDWTEGSVEFTMPPDAAFLRIMVHLGGPCRLWIDDVALDERVDSRWQPLMQPGLPPEHDFVRQWVELFHGEGRPYLMLGEMIHPPKLIAPASADEPAPFAPIMLNAFRASDGSEAAVIVNATDKEQNVRYEWHKETAALRMPSWTMRLIIDRKKDASR